MKKKIFTLLLALVAIATTAQAQVVLNSRNFPDANFRAALAEILKISEGDEITAEMIATTTSLDVSRKQIADLAGIEHFTALTDLNCLWNYLTVLDVSDCTSLKNLVCWANVLTSLDVSGCTALTYLECGGNQLTSLNVSKNTALTTLQCKSNQLTSLDVSGCTKLTRLECLNNQLISLDVSGCTELTRLECDDNQLNTLDVSGCTALTILQCNGNQLTALGVSQNSALKYLYCGYNQLTSLDVSRNMALTGLSCYDNQLNALDVSKNAALTHLSCSGNQLTSLDVSKNAALILLYCNENQLTSLDVSNNTALTSLECGRNQLTSLDVSKNTALTYLACGSNQLTSLDVSKNTALTYLACGSNQLTSLDVSGCTALTELRCYNNQIKGAAMDEIVASMPTVESGKFYVINTKDANEGNVCTKSQVAIAKENGWTVYDYNGGGTYNQEIWSYVYPEYEGSDPVEEDIDPVDENDNVDFGSDMDENSDLDGNVIGDIFYNISDGNGEYNSEEGCIVVTRPTADGIVNNLEGKDIFGEDVKNNFTGIIFKVPAGKGTIKVNAETTGNMLLKVKIGSNDPVEMELNGKLKVTFPYNVSEETRVYIFAGATNEAKGFGKASATDAALKIYGIEFLRDDATSIENNNRETITNNDWYSIDGKKLNGEPTKKGVYITKGKKVVK